MKLRSRSRSLDRIAAVLLVLALGAPVVSAGAILADDLRDMMDGQTGLADNPETPGPDLYAPIAPGQDIPEMPSLIDLDGPVDAAPASPAALVAWTVPSALERPLPSRHARAAAARAPPAD